MTEDLKTLAQIKYGTDTKNFLNDARALIELVNLVDSYRLRNTKLSECCVCKVNEHNESHRKSCSPHRKVRADDMPRQKRTARRETARSSKTRSIESNAKTLQLKRMSKCQLEIVKPKIDKDIKLDILKPKTKKERSRQVNKHSQKRSDYKKNKSMSVRTVRALRSQVQTCNLDTTNLRIQSLKTLYGLNENNKSRKAKVLLSKTNRLKPGSRTKKPNLSDSILLETRKKSKQGTKKQTFSHRSSRNTDSTKPSLHLMLDLHLKPNSNVTNKSVLIKMKIQSERKKHNPIRSSEPNVLSICLPYKRGSTGRETRISKILENKHSRKFNTSNTMRETMQSPNDQMMKNQDSRCPKVSLPYHKTQAVYNVYDVVPYQNPRQVQGMKSNISFNATYGQPPTEQTEYTDETGSINTQYGRMVGRPCQVRYNNKLNYNSGWTSLAQSLSMGRTNPQSESYYPSDTQCCDCETPESVPCESYDQPSCDTCCQMPVPQQRRCQESGNLLENCLLIFKRTRRRFVNVSREASSAVFNPGDYLKKLKSRYAVIDDRVEQRLKDASSYTRGKINTDQFYVSEEKVEPRCSFLQRCFGSLLYNDKCIVCKQNTPPAPEKGRFSLLKRFQCAPGVCVPARSCLPGLKKRCEEYKERWRQKQLIKMAIACERKKAKEKAQKEAEKRRKKEYREKLKRQYTCGNNAVCRFLVWIFNKKCEDQRKLLKKGKKGRKHGDAAGKKGKIKPGTEKKKTKGRNHFTRACRRIKDKYYRNKKLAEEQKGRYACDFYLLSLRNRPCLWVYYMCPWCYPHCLQALNFWRQLTDLLLFFVAIIVWSPCIFFAEFLKAMVCNMAVT